MKTTMKYVLIVLAMLSVCNAVVAGTDKTLVSWVCLANTTQQGGSALTIQRGDQFDAIVFGERISGRWMAGSDTFNRTQVNQQPNSVETADDKTLIQMAIVYQGNQISIYRNGEPYAAYEANNIDLLSPADNIAVFGLRHQGAGSCQTLQGAIEDARIYDRTLTVDEIKNLKPNQPSEIKPYAWWTFEKGEETDRMGRFPVNSLGNGARIENGRLILDAAGTTLIAAAQKVAITAAAPQPAPTTPPPASVNAYKSPIHFMPSRRAVGDVMPFYWKGEYHVFYLTNPTGNNEVNWEHAVSKDLVTWKELPPALTPDKSAPTGPEGECMFTGCVVEKDGVFHAWYTSWNPGNPAGREFISHATSKDLIQWTKHPEHIIAPDGIHYANHHDRDFRDPQIFWNGKAKEYWMHFNGNVPGKQGFRFGLMTSKDLVTWQQENPVEGVPGDECPDYFRIGDTHYIHSCRLYCYSDRVEGPYKYPELTREIDMPCIIAAKRCWDGKRHVWFGGWQTGGPMAIPREVYAGPNGLLYMKPVPEVVNVFKHTALDLANKPELTQSGAQWRYDGHVLRSHAGKEKASAVFSVPEHYMLDCLVTMTPGSQFAIAIGGHYLLSLTPENGNLSLTGPDFNRTRPCPVDIAKPVKIQVFAEGKLIECFVNDQFAQTCTVGTTKERRLGVSSEGGPVEILKLAAKTSE